MEKASAKNNFHYNKELRKLASFNRNNMTKSAACMWKYVLSKKQMRGFQFRRERPILNYLADFVCFDLMLIVEIDGITHQDEKSMKEDYLRDKNLEMIGFTTLRFSSWEVLNRIVDVQVIINNWIDNKV